MFSLVGNFNYPNNKYGSLEQIFLITKFRTIF